MEEEGPDALEVGPQTYAAKDAQDGAEESVEDLSIFPIKEWSARREGIIY